MVYKACGEYMIKFTALCTCHSDGGELWKILTDFQRKNVCTIFQTVDRLMRP